LKTQTARFLKTISGFLFVAVVISFVTWGAVARAAAASPADASSAIQSAQHQFDEGNYTAAITALQSAVSQNSSSAEAYYWLARSYYEMRDYDNSVEHAEKSVSLDPKNSLYHQWLGRAYGGKADRDRSFSLAKKVKAEFKEAVNLNPSNIAARRDLEQYCLDAPWIAGGSKDEALQQVNAISALDPVEGHLARAVYNREGLKKPDDAESEMRQVLTVKTKTAEPYFEVAEFFEEASKPSEIGLAIDAAAQVSPNDPRLTYYRAVADVLSNADLTGAERDLKSYLASTPDRSDWPAHAAAREWLGRLYEGQGKRAEAAEQYRAALQLEPKRKDAKERLEKLEKGSS
jgi:tetratricopeptide (TPR) repeat protein